MEQYHVAAILSFFGRQKKHSNAATPFLEFLNSWEAPEVDSGQMFQLKKDLSSGKDPVAILKEVCSSCSFDVQKLTAFLGRDLSKDDDLRLAIPFVISSALAFIGTEEADSVEASLILILTCLKELEFRDIASVVNWVYVLCVTHALTLSREFSLDTTTFICEGVLKLSKEVLEMALKMLEKEKDWEKRNEIFALLKKTLTSLVECNIEFSDEYLVKVLTPIVVEELHPEAMECLVPLAKISNSHSVSELYGKLPAVINELSAETGVCDIVFCGKETVSFSEFQLSDKQYPTVDMDLSEEWDAEVFNKHITTGTYLNPAWKKKIKGLLCLLHDIDVAHLDVFFDSYADVINDDLGSMDHDLSRKVFEALLFKPLFEPTVVLYTTSQDFEVMSFYRDRVVAVCMCHCTKFLPDLLEKYADFPLLFTDIVVRLRKQFLSFFPKSLTSECALNTVLSVDLRLAKIYTFCESDKDMIRKARASVIGFFFDIFRNPIADGIQIELFIQTLQNESFLSFLVNKLANRIHAVSFLSNTFAVLKRVDTPEPVFTMLFDIAADTMHESPALFLTMLNNLMEFVNAQPTQSRIDQLMKLMLDFLTKIGHIPLGHSVIPGLSSLLINNKYSSKDVLFSMLASRQVESSSSFIIAQPKLLPLVVAVSSACEGIDMIFERLSGLCDYSNANRSRMFEGAVDILILDMIFHFPDDFDFRGFRITNYKSLDKLLDAPVHLFLKIASNMSSEVAANRILMILSPECHSHKERAALEFLDRILPLSETVVHYQKLAYPIGIHQPLFQIDNFPFLEMMQRGMTFTTWLFIDEPLATTLNVPSAVFSILFKHKRLDIVIQGSSVSCVVSEGADQTSVRLLDRFPMNRWALLTINFKFGYRHKFCVTGWRNETAVSTMDVKVKIPNGDSVNFTFVGGNSREHRATRSSLQCIYQLRQLACYNYILNEDAVRTIVTDGWKKFTKEPFFCFPPLKTVESRFPLKLLRTTKRVWAYPNLQEVFRFNYPITKLIHIFGSFDRLTDEYSLLLLRALPGLYGLGANQAFTCLPKFMLTTSRGLSLQHYLEFVHYLKECQTPEEKIVLCRSLLCNLAIWVRCEWSECKSIMQRIRSDLFESFSEYVASSTFFIDMIGSMRTLFYVSEEHDASTFERHPSMDVNEGLSILERIIVTRCEVLLKENDLDIFLESILYCQDSALARRLLRFLPSLIRFRRFHTSDRHVEILLSVDFRKNPDMLIHVMRAVNMMKGDLYNRVVRLLTKLPCDVEISTLLTDVIEFPELFPLCFMLALHSDESKQLRTIDYFLEAMQDAEYRKNIRRRPFWMLWPILFALHSGEDAKDRACDFISSLICCEFNVELLFSVMMVLKLLKATTTLDVLSVEVKILQKATKILKDDDAVRRDHLVKYAFGFLFIEAVCVPYQREMVTAFQESPFKYDCTIKEKLTKVDSIALLRQVFAVSEIEFCVTLPSVPLDCRENALEMCAMLNRKNRFIQLTCMCLEYDKANSEKCRQLYLTLNKCMKDTLQSLLSDLKHAALSFGSRLRRFLTFTTYNLEATPDPLDAFMTNMWKITDLAEDQWRAVMKDTAYRMEQCKYRRDFTFSPNFNSILLKPFVPMETMERKMPREKTGTFLNVFQCTYVQVSHSFPCELGLTKTHMHLASDARRMLFRRAEIKYILPRNRAQKPTALEFFYTNGSSVLLDFAPVEVDTVLPHFDKKRCPNCKLIGSSDYARFVGQTGLLKKWASGRMTNFTFIMKLNMFSGRSFKDTKNSIIFPFVHLKQSRKLRLPTPAQSEERVAHFLQVLDNMGYCFGTAPVNSMLLSYYFPRIEPYTTLHQQIHDGKFDCRERMFTSWDGFVDSLLNGEEYKEASPEFYCFPEMFLDLNTLSIGDLDVNTQIYEWVYQNRKWLESDQTSKNLNSWIDSIWGVNQKGTHEKINCFIPYVYNDVWNNPECEPSAVTAMVDSLGSIPPQIFNERVPRRKRTEVVKTLKQAIKLRIPKVKNIREGFIFEKENVRLILCFEEGIVQRYSIRLDRKEVESVYLAPLKLKLPRDTRFVMQRSTVSAFDSKTDRIYSIGFEQMKTIPINTSVEHAFAGKSEGEFMTVAQNGMVQSLAGPDYRAQLLFSVSEAVTAADFNKYYGVFIAATTDGFLRFYSTRKRREVRKVKLDGFGEKVMTTNGLGFVVVYSRKQLFLFTLNGSFIKKASIQCSVYRWSQWKDPGGFDNICVTDPIGRIYVFEAFYPDSMKQIASLNERIVSVSYSFTTNSIVAVGSEPNIHLIPLCL